MILPFFLSCSTVEMVICYICLNSWVIIHCLWSRKLVLSYSILISSSFSHWSRGCWGQWLCLGSWYAAHCGCSWNTVNNNNRKCFIEWVSGFHSLSNRVLVFHSLSNIAEFNNYQLHSLAKCYLVLTSVIVLSNGNSYLIKVCLYE